ncbi:hypothetical protein O3G_MSEX014876 [Manduca sexta]|uniref:Uncharacterized protein n=1 Tax=Manduca sexta TaxID=7130 RepID=A0A922D029_MANSE|nr:hypothetical protein O3G_MSEX014876 [Manduca sexta]
MSCSVLRVLMWKHFTVRIRRYIHSSVELLTPLIFFVILLAFKEKIIPTPYSAVVAHQRAGVQQTEPFTLGKENVLNRIFYYPDGTLPERLMQDVGLQMRKQKLPNLDGPYKWASGYYGLHNESELNEKSVIQNRDAVLIFHNLDGTDWPTTLNYTIRMKGIFNTERIEPMDGQLVPHDNFGEFYTSFCSRLRVYPRDKTSYTMRG